MERTANQMRGCRRARDRRFMINYFQVGIDENCHLHKPSSQLDGGRDCSDAGQSAVLQRHPPVGAVPVTSATEIR